MTVPNGTRVSLPLCNGRDALAGEQGLTASANGDLPVSEHALVDDGTLRVISRSPSGLTITGEIDESTYRGLVGALERFTGGQDEVHIDLAGLEYCDPPGLRAIIGLTGAHSPGHDQSRRVVLHRVPPDLKTVLRILGWDSTRGLTMDERDTSAPPGAPLTVVGERMA
jgi:ABC-type transporter Mla MlaB component